MARCSCIQGTGGPEAWLSIHATKRARQRGIKNAAVSLLLDYADRETPIGSGCTSLTLSRRHAVRLRKQGIESALVDQATEIALVLGRSGRVVTMMHLFGRQAKRYRRSWAAHLPRPTNGGYARD